jgi:hypothetical protein
MTFESKSDFYKANNINPEELSWLGKGEFGDAYSIGDGRVLKNTTSKKEFSIAQELVGRNIPHLANIYATGEVKLYNHPSKYFIILEELEEDSSIEDMFYDLMNIVEEQGASFEYLGDIDLSDLNLNEEMIEFIDTIETIYRMCYNNGIYQPDVRPENLGRDKNGVIKMFDIDSHDRRLEETVRKIIRQLFNEEIKIPIEIGDEILGGKFKNKKVKVKEIGKNDKGDIIINGKPLLRFRIPKK